METLHNEQTFLEGRKRVCESLDWTPTEENPLPPGMIEVILDEWNVTYSHNITAFLNATYVGGDEVDRMEASVIDAIHAMAHNVKTNLERGREEGWNLTATIGMIFEASDGSPRSWMNPGYMGVFRLFLPMMFEYNHDYVGPLDTPLEQRHLDRIEAYRLGNITETTVETTHGADNQPYSGSALAHDDGTRQEIVTYSSEDEGFEFGSDEEYPMEEPFTAKEIETRDNCSKILQILDGVMEKGGTVTDGNYLEMCNILKELYKK